MTELNPLQEAIIPHLGKVEYQQLVAEIEELENENIGLKQRVDHLERQIATHAFGGWQTH
jgi:hypothetical protein